MEGGDKDRLGNGEREEAQTELEASAGRAQTLTKALVCQSQALGIVIQSQAGELQASELLGGLRCRFLNPAPALESHSGMRPKHLALAQTFSVSCPPTRGSEG